MTANSALAPSETAKTTMISQPSRRLVSGGRVAGTPVLQVRWTLPR
jgi:hypothetical protein